MKTRERSAAGGGGGRQSVPAPTFGGPGGGERLPTAPRERKPALAALAVLLILLGALGATVMVIRAGNKISVVEVTQPVAAGDPIPASAMREVMLTDASGVDFVLWKQRGDLAANWRAKTNLVPNSVLVKSMITGKDDVLTAGKAIVGLSLKDGQFPQDLQAGDTVAAYLVGNVAARNQTAPTTAGAGTGLPGPISPQLLVKSVSHGGSSGLGSGNTSVTVLVDTQSAGPLTVAASGGNVSLVLVASPKN